MLIVSIMIVAVAGSIIAYSNNHIPKSQETRKQVEIPVFSHKVRYNFDNDSVGSLPTYLQAGMTGGGTRSEWSVRQDSTAPSPPNVLAQTADEAVDYHFPYVILPGQNFKDVRVSVSFKPVSGRIDQAAGIIFRFVDSGNYYVLRANALEGNIILFKYVAGSRSAIASASTPVSSGQWHTLSIVAVGDSLLSYLDSKLLIDIKDSTFSEGKVGLWTKADSIIYFDDLLIEY